jgi:hypothetical protein
MTSTITATTAAGEVSDIPRASLLRRVVASVLEGRTRSTERRIAIHLTGLSDQRLADLGFSAADIASIRAGEPIRTVIARRAARVA